MKTSRSTMQYKGYTAQVTYDDEEGLLYGDVLDLSDTITASGRSVSELRRSLERAVDAYLDWCSERGEEPERPFSGKLNLRLEPTLHREAVVAAASRRVSLNAFIVWCVERGVASVGE
jgi:predicted HicB family RNase H-like nuclease